MKKYSLYVLTIFFLFTFKVYTQDEFLSLGQELTKINENHLDKSFQKIFQQQQDDSLSEIDEEMAQLQVSHLDLKQKINQYLNEKVNCPVSEAPVEKKADDEKKGKWEVVLLVKASGEKDHSQQIIREHIKTHPGYESLLAAPTQEALVSTFEKQIENMDEEQVLNYISYIGQTLPYNIERSKFKQEHNQKGLGLFDILSDQKSAKEKGLEAGEFGGICGDIHYALGELVKLANSQGKMNCDYITMSYTTSTAGHVVGGCAKPNGEFLVLNYGEARLVSNANGVSSLQPGIGTSSMPDVGSRIRIYGHTKKGADHIATLKNEVGSFLYSMNLKKELHTISPLYDDYSNAAVEINHSKEKNSLSSQGKQITKEINQGLRFYSGRLQNSQEVFGVAVYREAMKKKGKTIFSSSNALSVNKTNSKNFEQNNSPVNLYFIHHYGIQTPLLQKEGFQLVGEISEQIEGNAYFLRGSPKSFDGDLNLNAKLKADYKFPNKKTAAGASIASNHAIGVKDQRNLYNFKELPQNVKLTTNALQGSVYFSHLLDNDQAISAVANIVTTQVGSKYDVVTSYAQGVHHVYVKYENNRSGLYAPYNMNLLPNARKGVETGINTRIPSNKNQIEASAQARYDFNHGMFFGAGIKLKLNAKGK